MKKFIIFLTINLVFNNLFCMSRARRALVKNIRPATLALTSLAKKTKIAFNYHSLAPTSQRFHPNSRQQSNSVLASLTQPYKHSRKFATYAGMSQKEAYEFLGLDSNYKYEAMQLETIKRSLSQLYHPDKNQRYQKEATDFFIKIEPALKTVMDHQKLINQSVRPYFSPEELEKIINNQNNKYEEWKNNIDYERIKKEEEEKEKKDQQEKERRNIRNFKMGLIGTSIGLSAYGVKKFYDKKELEAKTESFFAAIKIGDFEKFKNMAETKDFDINTKDKKINLGALFLAAYYRQKAMVQYLLSREDFKVEAEFDGDNMNALMHILKNDDDEIAELLLNHKNNIEFRKINTKAENILRKIIRDCIENKKFKVIKILVSKNLLFLTKSWSDDYYNDDYIRSNFFVELVNNDPDELDFLIKNSNKSNYKELASNAMTEIFNKVVLNNDEKKIMKFLNSHEFIEFLIEKNISAENIIKDNQNLLLLIENAFKNYIVNKLKESFSKAYFRSIFYFAIKWNFKEAVKLLVNDENLKVWVWFSDESEIRRFFMQIDPREQPEIYSIVMDSFEKHISLFLKKNEDKEKDSGQKFVDESIDQIWQNSENNLKGINRALEFDRSSIKQLILKNKKDFIKSEYAKDIFARSMKSDDFEIVLMLLKSGLNVNDNFKNGDYTVPLFYFAQNFHMFKIIQKFGANFSLQGHSNVGDLIFTILHYVMYNDHIDPLIIQEYARFFDKTPVTSTGDTPWHILTRNCHCLTDYQIKTRLKIYAPIAAKDISIKNKEGKTSMNIAEEISRDESKNPEMRKRAKILSMALQELSYKWN